ncbi:MAG: hypothetical protein FWJ66_01845 [Caldibacillus sp.]
MKKAGDPHKKRLLPGLLSFSLIMVFTTGSSPSLLKAIEKPDFETKIFF